MSTIAPSVALPVAMPFMPDSQFSGLVGQLLPTQVPQSAAPGQEENANDRAHSPEAVGKGFEEIFASILIKNMRQTVGENGMFGHDPGDVLGGMFDHFMSQHIAKSGRLGIGKMIQRQMEKRNVNHE